ncbi:MAG: ABC transporter ATP-binding protein [Gammaproteobacteria bacterium]|nr:ABC transporter ATP-binding protein [Gammaproteobacteria bacterium]
MTHVPAPLPSSTAAPDSLGAVLRPVLRHKHALALAQVFALLTVLASIPLPLLMPLLVDEVLLKQPGVLITHIHAWFPPAWWGPVLYISVILGITVALRFIAIGLGVLQNRQFTLIAKDITFQLRSALLTRLQTISLSEYETLGTGKVASHFVTDMNTIDEFIGSAISKFLIAVLSVIGVSSVLLWIHWKLALFILLLNPLVIYFTLVLGKKVKQLKKHENRAFELFQQALIETLDGIRQIRASHREQHYLKTVIDRARGIRSHAGEYAWRADAANRFSFGIFLVGFDIFRAVSMLMVVYSNLTIGEMMAVFGYLWFMMAPVQEILGIQYQYFSARAAQQRINNLQRLQSEPVYPHRHNPFRDKTTVGVRLERIVFRYGDREPVLEDISLTIKPGEKIALVGASGGGKSTLAQVLLGLYPLQSGMVYFDGIAVTEIGLDVVRQHVAIVLQQPALFNDSVRNNLTMGISVSDEQLWQALDIAQLGATIRALPQGLEAIIGQDGVRLSGGQQQRLAIARMILSKPNVVILDEATSALDTQTETQLHLALQNFLRQRTTIIVAHRLSAVRQADHVYVFDGGQIIEQGQHQELIQNGGIYQRLYGNQ